MFKLFYMEYHLNNAIAVLKSIEVDKNNIWEKIDSIEEDLKENTDYKINRYESGKPWTPDLLSQISTLSKNGYL